jgi:hypothetical protein
MNSNTSAMQLLEHSISLWSSLTPLSASEQREKGAHWEEVARLAGGALKEAASDEVRISLIPSYSVSRRPLA